MPSSWASGLQNPSGMKLWTAAFLAILALAGCGVGVDDPAGQAAASGADLGVATQALGQADSAGEAKGPTAASASSAASRISQAAETTGGSGLPDPGVHGLPQDPVPLKPGPGRPDNRGGASGAGDPRPLK